MPKEELSSGQKAPSMNHSLKSFPNSTRIPFSLSFCNFHRNPRWGKHMAVHPGTGRPTSWERAHYVMPSFCLTESSQSSPRIVLVAAALYKSQFFYFIRSSSSLFVPGFNKQVVCLRIQTASHRKNVADSWKSTESASVFKKWSVIYCKGRFKCSEKFPEWINNPGANHWPAVPSS